MLIIGLSGLLAGILHVLSGPDHLAAVAPLAAGAGERRWRAGFNWGIGHTSGVLLVGTVALLLRGALPIDAISSWSERLVGVALIAVGVWGGWRALATRVHVHEHAHGGNAHTHVHVHFHDSGQDAATDAPPARPAARTHARTHARHAHRHAHTSFAFGILHGLAGSSHILGILPALALPTRAASVTYLACYGVGNVGAMTAFSQAVGLMASRAAQGSAYFYRGLLYACSAAAILVGGVWLM